MAKKKEEKTNVMRILDQRKIPYTARFYKDSRGPEGTREYGVHVADGADLVGVVVAWSCFSFRYRSRSREESGSA